MRKSTTHQLILAALFGLLALDEEKKEELSCSGARTRWVTERIAVRAPESSRRNDGFE